MSDARRKRVINAETRKKLSEAHQGNKYCLGYKHSAETRAKMSASAPKRKSKAHREAISRALMGHEVPESTRRAVSAAHLGTCHSAAVRAKISKGRPKDWKISAGGIKAIKSSRTGTRLIHNGTTRRWHPKSEKLPRGWRFCISR
jgi:hypothetical protein